VSEEEEKLFCAANCTAVRPLLRQASTHSRQRTSSAGLRVRMRVTVPRRRDTGNDADSRSAYGVSSVVLDHSPKRLHLLAVAVDEAFIARKVTRNELRTKDQRH
jgi:hypothetical protein